MRYIHKEMYSFQLAIDKTFLPSTSRLPIMWFENNETLEKVLNQISFRPDKDFTTLLIHCQTCHTKRQSFKKFIPIIFIEKACKEKGCYLFAHDCSDGTKFRIAMDYLPFQEILLMFASINKWHVDREYNARS